MELVYMSADNHSPELRTDKDLVVPSDGKYCPATLAAVACSACYIARQLWKLGDDKIINIVIPLNVDHLSGPKDRSNKGLGAINRYARS